MKPKTRQELAIELGMSYSTFRRWLKKTNIHVSRGLIVPADQKLIYGHYYEKTENLFLERDQKNENNLTDNL